MRSLHKAVRTDFPKFRKASVYGFYGSFCGKNISIVQYDFCRNRSFSCPGGFQNNTGRRRVRGYNFDSVRIAAPADLFNISGKNILRTGHIPYNVYSGFLIRSKHGLICLYGNSLQRGQRYT